MLIPNAALARGDAQSVSSSAAAPPFFLPLPSVLLLLPVEEDWSEPPGARGVAGREAAGQRRGRLQVGEKKVRQRHSLTAARGALHVLRRAAPAHR